MEAIAESEDAYRFHVRMPDDLRDDLNRVAALEDRSAAAVARIAIREYCDRRLDR